MMSRISSSFWFRLATGATALVALASCQEALSELDLASTIERHSLVIYSTQEGSYSDYETRTELVNGTSVFWGPADEINVFSAGEMAKFTSKNSERVAKATFAGTIAVDSGVALGDDAYVWALYPYDANASYSDSKIMSSLPSQQLGAENTFADDLFPMVGRSLNPFVDDGNAVDFGVSAGGQGTSFYELDDPDDPDNPGGESTVPGQKLRMTFKNIASGFRFTVDRSDIVSVTMTAIGGEALTGSYTVTFNSSDVPSITAVTDPSSSVTLTAPDGGTFTPGVSYYMVNFPGAISSGVTFSFVTKDGMTGTRTISSSFTFQRSKFTWKEHLDKNVVFTPDSWAESSGEFVYSTHTVNYEEDFRGVWVATVNNTDFPKTTGATAQKAELVELFTNLKRQGFNAIIFQVCPMADAFWESDLLPWSVYLTGTQGQDPGYDPLQFAIDTAHSLGMELHAWFNPYRVGSTSAVRTDNHPVKVHPEWAQTYTNSSNGEAYYWNPGLPEVRDFITSVMEEVVANYKVDGTHIDDYFYPAGLYDDEGSWDDSEEFQQYGDGKTLKAWRIDNVNETLRLYQMTTHSTKANVVFGASPAGNLTNCHKLYAYPEDWLNKELVDYLTPQIYWDHSRTDGADFNTRLQKFLNMKRRDDCPIIVGVAPYKVFSNASSDQYFKGHPEEMLYQKERVEELGLGGMIWYDALSCLRDPLDDYIPENVYTHEVLTPHISRNPSSLMAPVVKIKGTTLSWSAIQGAGDYVVLELTRKSSTSTEWDASIVYSGSERSFTGQRGHYYIVLARNGSVRSSYFNVAYMG